MNVIALCLQSSKRAPRSGSRSLAGIALLTAALAGAAAARGETYFNDEGIAFHAYETPRSPGGRLIPTRVQLWRLIDSKKIHAFTTSDALKKKLMNEAGAVLEPCGVFVSSVKLERMVPLYEFKFKSDSRTVLVVGEEGRNDLLARPDEFEEIHGQCYVYPPADPGEHSAPVRLLRNPFTDVRLYTSSQSEIDEVLATRQRRLQRLADGAAKLLPQGRAAGVTAVGESAEAGRLRWRFEHSALLNPAAADEEKAGGNGDKAGGNASGSGRPVLVTFDVTVENVGLQSQELAPPFALVGEKLRVAAVSEASSPEVEEILRNNAQKSLGSHERRRFRFVYELPPRSQDVSLEVHAGAGGEDEVAILDTGR